MEITYSLPNNTVRRQYVGGIYSSVVFIRPNNTTAYDASDLIGIADAGTPANAGSAIHELANVGPYAGAVIKVNKVALKFDILSVPAGMTTFKIHLFNASPTVILDNDPWVGVVLADREEFLGTITLGAAADLGSQVRSVVTAVNEEFKLAEGSTSLFALIETVGGFTPAASTAITLEAFIDPL